MYRYASSAAAAGSHRLLFPRHSATTFIHMSATKTTNSNGGIKCTSSECRECPRCNSMRSSRVATIVPLLSCAPSILRHSNCCYGSFSHHHHYGIIANKSCGDVIYGSNAVAFHMQRRGFRRELCEGPLDLKAGERSARKGPPVAHSLPVYKTAHKLNHSVRWKNANLITNVAGGKDYRLRETQGEGTFDESGMYRDWLYGDERRYANYIGVVLGVLSISLFLYTMRVMGAETWDIPTPVLAAQRKKRAAALPEGGEGKEENLGAGENNASGTAELQIGEDALAMLKKPAVVSKAALVTAK
ncbi:uncharacterized protein TEOVI_000528600 [Trypanosoma equiperdum]|uniref:Uncharacterized protein n=2 Tax=Trypanozoon TaxID=39700 RepID=Q57XR9_TRYB2|nr:hypothetical protein, conserved [Trypanosoma brucei brucei TREU927]AAX69599.1 hypothetical protein, conserved [Trypanosoma brucei]AAZ12760.1 hypothetical protein, conserved [Trypanosoma brucei brucei TREU927]SCU64524.1 hypothetical protein, conserved [Trypanosoma equiperdum]